MMSECISHPNHSGGECMDCKVDKLEATIAELKAVIAEALSNMEYYPASLGEMWLVQDKDITAMQEEALEKNDAE